MVHYLSYFGQHSQFSFEPSLLCCLCQLLWLSWRLRPLTRGFSGKVRNCLYLAWFVRAVSQCTCPQCWCILICSIYFLSYASFSRFFAFFLNRSGSFCCEITSTSLSLAWSALHLGHLDVQQHHYTFKHFTIFFSASAQISYSRRNLPFLSGHSQNSSNNWGVIHTPQLGRAQRRHQKQKCGKHTGQQANLKANLYGPTELNVFLQTLQDLWNKTTDNLTPTGSLGNFYDEIQVES